MKHKTIVKVWILLMTLVLWQQSSGSVATRILEADLMAVHADGSTVVVADHAGNLRRSEDGGINFTVRHQGSAADRFFGLSGRGGTLLAVGAAGWMQRSVDAGRTWSAPTAPALLGQLNAVAGNGSGVWVAVGRHLGSAASVVSTDNGVSWTLHSVSGVYELTSVSWHAAAGRFVAGGGDGFFRGALYSSANGSAWSELSVPAGTPMLHFVASDGGNGLLAGGEEGALLRAVAGSLNFTPVGGLRVSETLRSAVAVAADSWVIGGDQAVLIAVSGAAAGAVLVSGPVAEAHPIVAMANRSGSEILLAGAFASYPWEAPRLQAALSNGQLTLSVPNARPGRTYRVQGSADLNLWSDIQGSTRQATQPNEQWTLPVHDTHLFFRILVE